MALAPPRVELVRVNHLIDLRHGPGGLGIARVGPHVEARKDAVAAHGEAHQLKVLCGKLVAGDVENGQLVVGVADYREQCLSSLQQGVEGREVARVRNGKYAREKERRKW